MSKVTLFRVDNYNGNNVNLAGFYLDIDTAKSAAEFSESVDKCPNGGEYSQITEFTSPADVINNAGMLTTQRILEDNIWGAGEIINYYYFI